MSDERKMKIRRSDKAIWRIIDNEVVLLIPEKNILYALGGCGSRVWEIIEEPSFVSEIVHVICNEYEVEPKRVREDINTFIEDLTKLELVEPIPEANKEINQ